MLGFKLWAEGARRATGGQSFLAGLGGGAIADPAVGPFLVVVAAVILGQDAGFGDAEHEFPVKALIAQAAVEAFDVPVLPGAAWFDIERLDPAPGQPVAQDAGDELRAVVAADVLGRTPFGHQSFHHFDQIVGRELARHMQREAFPTVLVEEGQDAQPPAVVGAIGHEVPAPNVVEPLGPRRDRARGLASSATSRQPSLHPQPALAPQTLYQLLAHLPALGPQQPRELAVAQARMLARQSFEPFSQPQQPLRRSLVLVTSAGPV